MKLETTCLGRLTAINDRCRTCKKDEANKNCEDYYPMQIHTYFVFKPVISRYEKVKKEIILNESRFICSR